MKHLKLVSLSLFSALILFSCSNDDTPELINEEEFISTLQIELVDDTNPNNTAMLSYEDLSGNGNATITTDQLTPNTTYTGSITFLNETVMPVDDITLEVIEEAEDHQVFYLASTSLNLEVTYNDSDANGNPLGVDFTLTTTDASQGEFTVQLIHEGNKTAAGVAQGNPANAGGETDIEVVFNLSIQ